MATDLDAKSEGVLRLQALRLHPAPVEVYQFCVFAMGIDKDTCIFIQKVFIRSVSFSYSTYVVQLRNGWY